MQTAGKKYYKKLNKKTAKKHYKKVNKNNLFGIPIQKVPEIKPMKSLSQTLKDEMKDVQKSLKPKSLFDIPEVLTEKYGKKDKELLKSPKELLPQSGGSDILTYEQNNYQNDPQHSMVDTRHIYNEQQNQTIQGGRKTMKRGKCGKKCNKKSL